MSRLTVRLSCRRLMSSDSTSQEELKWLWRESKKHKWKLYEKQLSEKFIRGWGKGGQAVNKLNNCVQLTHLPTKKQVRCHTYRSQVENRKGAREMLIKELDRLLHGSKCREVQIEKEERKQAARNRQRVEKRISELSEKIANREETQKLEFERNAAWLGPSAFVSEEDAPKNNESDDASPKKEGPKRSSPPDRTKPLSDFERTFRTMF